MVQRRTLLKAGLAVPFAPYFLTGCSPTPDKSKMTSFYEEGMYLSGNFAPVDIEVTSMGLDVKGAIPPDLTGRYLRNGPNPIGDVDVSSHHWFLGDGMIHGVRLEGGRAEWYKNRWVRSENVVAALGEALPGAVPSFGPNTHVIGHAGKAWALVESGTAPVALDYDLNTIGQSADWGGYTAHPKLDPDTGELHAICYDWARLHDHVQYVVVDQFGKESKRIDIPMNGMSMIHDMSLTKNHVVVYDFPVTVSLVALATGASFPFRWDESHEPRVGFMPRNGTADEIVWCSVAMQYAYHPMNAFEDDDGDIVIDIVSYDRMFDQDILGPFGDSEPKLKRWQVNLAARKVSETTIDDRPQEFPRCHPALNSKPYRYGYTLNVGTKTFPGIIKYDMATGETSMHHFEEGHQGAEPLFVPAENARSEDHGYLMTYVFDQNSQRSSLMILDARDMKRKPLATIYLPNRVPYGFHGSWLPDIT